MNPSDRMKDTIPTLNRVRSYERYNPTQARSRCGSAVTVLSSCEFSAKISHSLSADGFTAPAYGLYLSHDLYSGVKRGIRAKYEAFASLGVKANQYLRRYYYEKGIGIIFGIDLYVVIGCL